MLKYSEWLGHSNSPDKKVFGANPRARSNAPSPGLQTWDAMPGGPEDRMGQENARLIERYYAEVVSKAKLELPLAVRVLMDEQFIKMRHKGRAGTPTLQALTQSLDEFAERWTRYIENGFDIEATRGRIQCVSISAGTEAVGSVHLHRATDPDGFPFIGGSGQTLSAVPETSDLMPMGNFEVYPDSADDFRAAPDGSAFVGICQIAARTGVPSNVIFLFANNPMRTHLTFAHHGSHQYKLPLITHGAAPGHQVATTIAFEQGHARATHLNGHPADGSGEYKDDWQEYGIAFGFSMVKGDTELGHYWNFTSMSCNNYACAAFAKGKTIIPGVQATLTEFDRVKAVRTPRANPGAAYWLAKGDNVVPKEWAMGIYNATRGLR